MRTALMSLLLAMASGCHACGGLPWVEVGGERFCVELAVTPEERARGLMTKHGAIGDTIGRARHFGEIARDALAPLAPTPQKDALLDVIDFCISRVN